MIEKMKNTDPIMYTVFGKLNEVIDEVNYLATKIKELEDNIQRMKKNLYGGGPREPK